MGANYDRGLLLYHSKKFKLAEKEFRDEIAVYPQSSMAHSMLALSMVAQGKGQKAHPEAVKSVQLAPDSYYAQYTLSFTFAATQRLGDAEKAVREALRLAPRTPYLFARAAEILYFRRKFAESLDLANQGLELDGNHEDCLVKRASALVELQRLDEADETIEAILRISPLNVQAHIEKGAVLLRRGGGEEKKAFECYREALRINPSSEAARLGVIASLKSRNPIFYSVLRLSFAMKRIPPAVTIIVVFLAFNIPCLKPIAFAACIIIVALEYAFLLMARFDPFAKPFLKSTRVVPPEERKRQMKITLFILSPISVVALLLLAMTVYNLCDHAPSSLMRNARSCIRSGNAGGAQWYYDMGASDAQKYLEQSQPAQSEKLVNWLLTETAANGYPNRDRVLQLALKQSLADLKDGRLAQCEGTAEQALNMVPESDPMHAELTKVLDDCDVAHDQQAKP